MVAGAAAAAALPSESTELSQSVLGNAARPLAAASQRLQDRRTEIAAALGKNPSKVSPPKKLHRTGEHAGTDENG
eukprot:6758902-Pyramimonas_sp.AAC.1